MRKKEKLSFLKNYNVLNIACSPSILHLAYNFLLPLSNLKKEEASINVTG
jgi:hypothetical protein